MPLRKGYKCPVHGTAILSTLPLGIEEAVSSKKGKVKLDLTELVIDLYDTVKKAENRTPSTALILIELA